MTATPDRKDVCQVGESQELTRIVWLLSSPEIAELFLDFILFSC